MNPHNMGYGFYVYGTFPVFFTKWVAGFFNWDNYADVTLIGRFLSGIVDLGTLLLVFLITKKIIDAEKIKKGVLLFTPHVSAFLYAITVLSIQLSHFYTVDMYLTFFLTGTFYVLSCILIEAANKKTPNLRFEFLYLLLGISFGFSVGSKISSLLFLPIIGLGSLVFLFKVRKRALILFCAIIFLFSTFGTIRFTQPYLFADGSLFTIQLNPKLLANWRELQALANPNAAFPPIVQWIHTKPYIYPLKHLIFYGLGVPLSIILFLGIIFIIFRSFQVIRERKIKRIVDPTMSLLLLALLWIILLSIYQGKQFSMTLRYFHPIFPFLAIVGGTGISFWVQKFSKEKILIGTVIGGFILLLYPLAFLSIYSRPVTRISASAWIYQHVPPGSFLAGEHWDDFLPVGINDKSVSLYQNAELPVYGTDNKEKWDIMIEDLNKTDYLILSSNRAFGSINSAPDRYPITSQYYQALFDGSLGFEKVAEFTSRPTLHIPGVHLCITPPFTRYGIIAQKTQECSEEGIAYVDDYADESFTVYDHPKVIIFKKIVAVDYARKFHTDQLPQ